ncbi:unnamed protein product [Schistosoma margrebowiei]|uniref:Uncharacterized protein n=1 Tax=Schistosoma margrebowiei TaxID=48269 RepID=A0A183LL95_9TREM|nr:unnamed protein product [Schistosoma margrebowiei]
MRIVISMCAYHLVVIWTFTGLRVFCKCDKIKKILHNQMHKVTNQVKVNIPYCILLFKYLVRLQYTEFHYLISWY